MERTHGKDKEGAPKKKKKLKCKFCDREFGYWGDIARHETVAHSNQKFPCLLCGKQFSCSEDVKQHLKGFCPKQKEGSVKVKEYKRKSRAKQKIKKGNALEQRKNCVPAESISNFSSNAAICPPVPVNPIVTTQNYHNHGYSTISANNAANSFNPEQIVAHPMPANMYYQHGNNI